MYLLFAENWLFCVTTFYLICIAQMRFDASQMFFLIRGLRPCPLLRGLRPCTLLRAAPPRPPRCDRPSTYSVRFAYLAR